MTINPGDKFSHNGITLIVHEIRDGQVYYEKRRDENLYKEWPQGNECWPLHRMDIEDFQKEAEGKEVIPPKT